MLQRRSRVLISLVLVASNLIGAAIAFAIANFLIPGQIDDEEAVRSADLIAILIYVPAALVVGVVWGQRRAASVRAFLREEREPTERERREVLLGPLRVAEVNAVLWGGAVLVFAVLNATFSLRAAISVTVTVALGGITTCAIAYLLSERLLRPTAARALASGSPEQAGVPGVAARGLIFWALGTGVPLFGLLLLAIGVLVDEGEVTDTEFAITTIVLSALALAVGLVVGLLASRATADPIVSVSDAMARVESGDLEAEVPVYDGSEVGMLQAGFNSMVAGLRERERIRETFGAYVDPDVAERILDEGIEGEEVDVTLLFLDVRDFTGFAEQARPEQVVRTLNALFERVVPVVRAHGGHVDKFIGDGLLAVFGSPRPADDHADRALQAAREIAEAVARPPTEGLEIGIGLNSGEVIAGNIGGAGRLEFSVIGDPVNVAARVEAATRETGDIVLLSEATRERLRGDYELLERPGVELKGKQERVSLWALRL